MTEDLKQARLNRFIDMLPQLTANHKEADSAHQAVLASMTKMGNYDNPGALGGALLRAGENVDEAWAELMRVKEVISYIQDTPADDLTELSIADKYAQS